jgi:hypothetical protein
MTRPVELDAWQAFEAQQAAYTAMAFAEIRNAFGGPANYDAIPVYDFGERRGFGGYPPILNVEDIPQRLMRANYRGKEVIYMKVYPHDRPGEVTLSIVFQWAARHHVWMLMEKLERQFQEMRPNLIGDQVRLLLNNEHPHYRMVP